MKIHITGNAGSGKSTLAAQVSNALGLPLYGLDAIVWQQNWRTTPAPERNQKILALVSQPNWVIDGVSQAVRGEADVVVFIDRHPLHCVWRALRRNRAYLFKPRPGLAKGCIEIKILPTLLAMIFRFNRQARPNILMSIADKPHVVLRTDADLAVFLADLKSKRTAVPAFQQS